MRRAHAGHFALSLFGKRDARARNSTVTLRVEQLEDRSVPAQYPANIIGAYPLPMNPDPPSGTGAFYQTTGFNADGTLASNPVIAETGANATVTIGGITYNLFRLTNNASLSYSLDGGGSQSAIVYSAIPETLFIQNAYQKLPAYYDPAQLSSGEYDFPSTLPQKLNGGQASTVSAMTQASVANPNENVYLVQPPAAVTAIAAGSNGQTLPQATINVTSTAGFPASGTIKVHTSAGVEDVTYTGLTATSFTGAAGGTGTLTTGGVVDGPIIPQLSIYIPNLPNTAGQHDGLTGNVYWVNDPMLGQPTFQPNGSNPHLEPYGWAINPQSIREDIFFQKLTPDAHGTTGLVSLQGAGPLHNTWLHIVQNRDNWASNLIPDVVNQTPNWPFPHDMSWVGKGAYFGFQPMPGFQSNLVRYYTPSGAWKLAEHTSGLFVRPDGSVELPATGANGDKIPLVTQTWGADGIQRFTILNKLSGVVPSTVDDYPGAEYYFPGNAYLPGKAGVWTSFKDFTVFDSASTIDPVKLSYRTPDTWLGFGGGTIDDVTRWDSAFVQGATNINNGDTEPGGQANKLYMLGADNHSNIFIQHGNSPLVAYRSEAEVKGKLYSFSLYGDTTGNGNYKKFATLTYEWHAWSLDASGKWQDKPWATINGVVYGSIVPQVSFVAPRADLPPGWIAKTQKNNWVPATRNLIPFTDPTNPSGEYQPGDKNEIGGVPQFYIVTGPGLQTPGSENFRFLGVIDDAAAAKPTALLQEVRATAEGYGVRHDQLTSTVGSAGSRDRTQDQLQQLLDHTNGYETSMQSLTDAMLGNAVLRQNHYRQIRRLQRSVAVHAQQARQVIQNLMAHPDNTVQTKKQIMRLCDRVDQHIAQLSNMVGDLLANVRS